MRLRQEWLHPKNRQVKCFSKFKSEHHTENVEKRRLTKGSKVTKVVPTQMLFSLPFPQLESLLQQAEGSNLACRAVHLDHWESSLAREAGTKCQVLWQDEV